MKWPVKKLGDICEIISGATPSTTVKEYWGDDFFWATPKDLSDLNDTEIKTTIRKISALGLKSCAATLLPINSVLFSSRAPIGLVAINAVPIATNQGFKNLVPNRNLLDTRYLYHWLTCNRKKIDAMGVGATFKEVSKAIVSKIEIPLPPLADQQRIAALLDTADRMLKQRQSAIAKLDQLVQSVFFDMFGDLVSNLNNWQVVKLNDACLIKAQYGAGLSAVEFNASLPRYVRITDINEDGFLNEKVVSPSGSKSDWQDYFLNDGDILFARSGATVGKAYLHSNQIHQCIFAGYLIRFVPNKKLMTSEFLYALTKSAFYKKWVKAKQNAVAQPNINANQYGNELVFPLPPITLQEEFTNFYKKIKSFKEVELLASIKHNQLQLSLQHQSFAVN